MADVRRVIGPFAGNIVTQAAFTFIYRFMSKINPQNIPR